jgi:NarL family two-component system response regulator LiaR
MPSHPPILRILIADDHAIVREGLEAVIATQSDMTLVGTAVNGVEAVSLAQQLNPDVTLMDLMMPHLDGLAAIQQIIAANPAARILVLTSFADDERVFPAIKAGAMGYLLKDTLPADLLQAIRDAAQGKTALHPTIARRMVQEIQQPATETTLDPLTARELETLRLIARGLTNQEIAAALNIREKTVANYVSGILQKRHLANRTQAALYALREGLASLDD